MPLPCRVNIIAVVRWNADLQTRLDQNGFIIAENLLTRASLQSIESLLEKLQHQRANVRNVLATAPEIDGLLQADGVFALAAEILPHDPILTRAILFDKKPGANWAVGWHQDVTIAVRQKLDVPGFSGWSIKEGVAHVQPPLAVLEEMLTVRLHIDDCFFENGPLQVLPGSHRKGRLSDVEINQWSQRPATTCVVGRGGAVVMRPLLLHRSSAAKSPSHRRVLHLEFAGEKLPSGLEWNVAQGWLLTTDH